MKHKEELELQLFKERENLKDVIIETLDTIEESLCPFINIGGIFNDNVLEFNNKQKKLLYPVYSNLKYLRDLLNTTINKGE